MNGKAFSLLVFLFALALVLPGCSDNSGGREGITVSDGRIIRIGDVIGDEELFFAKYGTPAERNESPSCLGEGTDIFYDYGGFSLTLYPNGEDHTVGVIRVRSSGYVLTNGIRVGDNISKPDGIAGYSLFSQNGKNYVYKTPDDLTNITFSVNESGFIEQIAIVYNYF